jgi:hypothetical protein
MFEQPMKYIGLDRKSSGMLLRIALITALLCSKGAAAAERTWTSQDVGHGIASSIAVDVNQNLHVVYLTSDARLMYAFRPPASEKWFSATVLASTHANQHVYPRIAVDKYDRPHICVSIGTLDYITFDGGTWKTQEVDPDSGTLSYHCSVAIAPNGTPHLSWYHEFLPDGKQFSHLRHAELDNGQWVVRSVDGGISGKWNSMAIDDKGFAHLVYSQWAGGSEIRYAAWDGKDWTVGPIATATKVATERGYDNSIAISPDGMVAVAYFDDANLRYAHIQDGKWITEKVTEVGGRYDYYRGDITVLLDKENSPHIIFGDVGALKHAFWDGKQWQVEAIVSGGYSQYATVGGAIGSDGTLYVSYSDPTDGGLKVAVGKVVTGSGDTKK